MSFVRQNRSSQPPSYKVKQKNKKKKKIPPWDNTMSDLSVHKLTSEEVERRKEVHQSKNLAAVRASRQMQALMKANRKKLLSQEDSERSSLLQEILYDEEQIRDAISHSDRVMAVVKDLFGDDPRVKSGKANVTLAPGMEAGDRAPRNLPDMTLQPSHLDVLSDTVMDQQALNDVDEDEEYSDESSKENQFQGFEGSLDLDRFRHFIAKESTNKEHHQEKWNSEVRRQNGYKAGKKINRRALKEWQANNLSDSERDRSYVEDQPETRAINDTAKVKKKSRARTSEENKIADQHDADLAKVIHGIQDEVRGYEKVTGKKVLPESDGGQSSSLTVFLVQTIRTLIHHLTEREKLAQNDETLSALQAQLAVQRNLIDALTTEMIITQEGLSRLEAQLLHGKVELKEDSPLPAQTFSEKRLTEVVADPEKDQGNDNNEMFSKPNQQLEETFEQRSQHGHQNISQQQSHHSGQYPTNTFTERNSGKGEGAMARAGVPVRVENQYLDRLRHEDPLQGDQAIMLSPPRQRDRRTLFKDHGPTLAKRELFASHPYQNEHMGNFGINAEGAAIPNKQFEDNRGSLPDNPSWDSSHDLNVPTGSAFRPSTDSAGLQSDQMCYPNENYIPIRDQTSTYRSDANDKSEVSFTSRRGDFSTLSKTPGVTNGRRKDLSAVPGRTQNLIEGRTSYAPPTDIGSQTLFHRVDWKLKDTSLMSTDSQTSYRSLPSMHGGEQMVRGGSSMEAPSEHVSSAQSVGQDPVVPVAVGEPNLITSEEGTLNAISDLNRRIAALSREHADAEERLGKLKKNQGLIYK